MSPVYELFVIWKLTVNADRRDPLLSRLRATICKEGTRAVFNGGGKVPHELLSLCISISVTVPDSTFIQTAVPALLLLAFFSGGQRQQRVSVSH